MLRAMYKGNVEGGPMKQPFPEFEGPTDPVSIRAAGPEQIVVLWRGTDERDALRIADFGTAGGVALTVPCAAPTWDQVRMQVGGNQPGGWTKLPEFTASWRVAQQFARGAVVCIWIKKKYLAEGSESESGWIALPGAPVEESRWEQWFGSSGAAAHPNAD